MNEKNNILWKKVLTDIEKEVSRGIFITLFKPTSLISLEGGVASIAAPSNMVIDLLQKRHYQIIKSAVDKHTKIDAKIIFVPKIVIKANSETADSAPLFKETEKKKDMPFGHLPRVRADYTFQTIAVSSSNQLAFVSATTVAKKIGSAYNPLFIYGPVGVGKTHLMQAIANEVYKNDPNKKIIYITSEEFTNEVVEAIRSNDTARMKRKFRNVDLLIIDDVQFFAGKERAQEELFHTFNILADEGAQMVLSSDRPPSEIKIEKRLSSRFAGGLTVDIEAADFELRTAILLIKAKKFNIDLPIESAKKIAEVAHDSRELEGLLLKTITIASARGEEITPLLVESAFRKHQKEEKHFFRPDEVIENICSFYNIKETLIKGPKRDARLVKARQIAMYMLKNDLSLSLVEIGNILGGRDHTTVMHGVRKIEGLLYNKNFNEEMLGIKSLLKKVKEA